MSSLPRRMQRKFARENGDHEPQDINIVGKTHTRTLHPTKGWRRSNNKRLAAQLATHSPQDYRQFLRKAVTGRL